MLGMCVFASSSDGLPQAYFQAAADLGECIATGGDTLVFGAGATGLMGAAARAAKQAGGRIVGVIPEALNQKGIVYEHCDECIVTKTMRERKAHMDELADAFIALPGGFGTLEELFEVITHKQLRYHDRPIVLLNTLNFYDGLIKQLETLMELGFAHPDCGKLYVVLPDAKQALAYVKQYRPPELTSGWLTDVGSTISSE